ncbi:MAG: arsenate reductase [Actinomycetota bacterium]|nr:arsenate reductase [Actinomycetota bacterium]MDQ3528708.1 arsenate reductase [Actinomycetota bacterium]
MDVQLFGSAGSKATRKAQRWFSERRVPVHFVDVRKRAPSPGELRRFVQRFGTKGVLDPDAKAYRDQGLQYVSASDDDWIDRMVAQPAVLRLPLVRCGNDLAVGDDEAAWQRFAEAAKS